MIRLTGAGILDAGLRSVPFYDRRSLSPITRVIK